MLAAKSRNAGAIAALAEIAAAGFDPVYGARPLKRAIQQQIENPLSKEILSGKYVAGETVVIDMRGGNIVFSKLQLAWKRRVSRGLSPESCSFFLYAFAP